MDSVQVELQAREQRLGQLTAQLAAEQQQVRRLEGGGNKCSYSMTQAHAIQARDS